MVLELSEAQFDVVDANSNVTVREGDPEVPHVGEEVSHDHAKGAVELQALFGGIHEVNGDGVLGGFFGQVEDELVFPSILDEVELWGEENVRCELAN